MQRGLKEQDCEGSSTRVILDRKAEKAFEGWRDGPSRLGSGDNTSSRVMDWLMFMNKCVR